MQYKMLVYPMQYKGRNSRSHAHSFILLAEAQTQRSTISAYRRWSNTCCRRSGPLGQTARPTITRHIPTSTEEHHRVPVTECQHAPPTPIDIPKHRICARLDRRSRVEDPIDQ